MTDREAAACGCVEVEQFEWDEFRFVNDAPAIVCKAHDELGPGWLYEINDVDVRVYRVPQFARGEEVISFHPDDLEAGTQLGKIGHVFRPTTKDEPPFYKVEFPGPDSALRAEDELRRYSDPGVVDAWLGL